MREIAFYRPIFREVLYNLSYSLFGLESLPLRIFQFIIHFINIYLVFNLVQKIYKNKFVSFFTAFFFGICAANLASFYYLAGGIQSQGATMFMLLTLILFNNHKILSFITFLAALSSHEQSVMIPVLLAGLIFTGMTNIKHEFKDFFKKIITLWPYFLVIAIYMFLNVKVIGYSSGETQYHLVFNPKTIVNSLAWYTTWALGAPETLIDFVLPGLKLNPSLMRYWGDYYKIIFSAFFISIGLLTSYLIILIVKSRQIFKDSRFWFFAIWFPLVLLPVLFLPQHKSTYYLYPALPAFWAIVGIIFHKAPKTLVVILIISLFTLSSTSAILGRTTYWAAGRGKLAEKIIKEVVRQYPTLPVGTGIYFTNDANYPFVSSEWKGSSNQAYFALNGEDGLQLIYKDPSLKVFYEDTGGVPKDFPKEKIKSLTAPF